MGRDSACRDYLDRSTLERVVEEHEAGRISRHQEIWTLLIFEFWHRVFITARGKAVEGQRGGGAEEQRSRGMDRVSAKSAIS